MQRLQLLCAALAAALLGFPAAARASAAVAQFGHVLFVTASSYSIDAAANPTPVGNSFGGLLAADLLVTQAAANAGLVSDWNGQDRIFTAVLSSATLHARDRVPIQGPVYNTAGDLLATSAADFWDGSLLAGVNYTETGQLLPPSTLFWSGSNPNGLAAATAGSWTQPSGQANVGFSGATQNWLSQGQILATGVRRLAAVGPLSLLDPGDLDGDKDVDGNDFLRWQRGLGRTGPALQLADGDANGDLVVNAADLAILKQNFGRSYGAAAQAAPLVALPEPTSGLAGLVAVAAAGHAARRSRRRL